MFERALVLGAAGMIGTHAVHACMRRQIPVRALVRPGSDLRNLVGLDVEKVTGDLTERASLERAMAGCSLVIHAAAAYPKRHFGARAFVAGGVREMENVLAALRGTRTPARPRLVYVSSSTTIGVPDDEPAPRPARETDRRPVRDSSPYFAVKFRMEALAEQASAENDIVVVNPTFCIDEFDARRSTAQLLIPLAQRRIPACLPGRVNAVATRDVGEGILLAAEHGRCGERYILGGENLTSRDLLARCAQVAGVPAPRTALPIAAAEAVSWLTEALAYLSGARPLFPMAGVRMMKHSQAFDLARAQEELGFAPGSLDEAIARAYAWYRAQGWL